MPNSKVKLNEAGLRELQRELSETLLSPNETRHLTKFQKRELLWLASVANDDGFPADSELMARNESFSPARRADFANRYRALGRFGYVDSLGIDCFGTVFGARLTEEGRDAAEQIIAEEIDSPAISEETKVSIRDALVSGGIGIASAALLKVIGLG